MFYILLTLLLLFEVFILTSHQTLYPIVGYGELT